MDELLGAYIARLEKFERESGYQTMLTEVVVAAINDPDILICILEESVDVLLALKTSTVQMVWLLGLHHLVVEIREAAEFASEQGAAASQ